VLRVGQLRFAWSSPGWLDNPTLPECRSLSTSLIGSGYNPGVLLKLYIYGYLNRVQSSRRLECEAGRNLEVMWRTGRLAPDHKTIADFRKDNGPAVKKVCAQFVELCRKMGLLAKASVVIDGSKFKAVNSRDNNFTKGKLERRLKQIEESVARYMSQLDTADRRTAAGEDPSETALLTKTRLKEKLAKLEEEVKRLKAIEKDILCLAPPADLADRSRLPLDGNERPRQAHATGSDGTGGEGCAAHGQTRSGRRSRLLQGRGNPGGPTGWHQRDAAETADLERESERPFRQAGFCLSAGGRCLPLSGGGEASTPLHR
jgi:transposase